MRNPNRLTCIEKKKKNPIKLECHSNKARLQCPFDNMFPNRTFSYYNFFKLIFSRIKIILFCNKLKNKLYQMVSAMDWIIWLKEDKTQIEKAGAGVAILAHNPPEYTIAQRKIHLLLSRCRYISLSRSQSHGPSPISQSLSLPPADP